MDRSILSFFYLVVIFIQCGATPLDDYVNILDPTYRYDVIDQIRGPSYTLYTVNMTSQTWKPCENTVQSLYNVMFGSIGMVCVKVNRVIKGQF